MPAKNIYLSDALIEWVLDRSEREDRTFSAYLSELIRADMKAKGHERKRGKGNGK